MDAHSRAAFVITASLLPLLVACSLASPGFVEADSLRSDLEHLRAEYPGKTIAVSYHDLGSGRALTLDGGRIFHAASTMKIPVMMEVFRQAGTGSFALDDPLPVKTTFTSIADGSPFTLDESDDSDASLYALAGQGVPIRKLVELMITRSSNLATNLLIERVAATSVQVTVERLGARGVKVLRGVEDGAAYRRGLNNEVTATGLAVLLMALAKTGDEALPHRDAMIAILRAQEFNEMIPQGLPAALRAFVAHKTGRITRIHHDAALIEPPDRPGCVLVILTEGFDDPADAAEAGRRIAARISAQQFGS